MENNARIKCSGYIPVKDIECLDEKQNLYIGVRVVEPGSPEDYFTKILFSRRYEPDKNEFDAIFREVQLPIDLLDEKVLLVPKDKVVAFYDPPSLIAKPDIKLSRYNKDM